MLTEQQLNELRRLLDDRYYQLREEVRQELLKYDDQSYQDLAGRVHDLEEASVADLLVDLQLSDLDRHIEAIRDIDAALMRIAQGTYGICIDCDQPIAYERLKAWPTARRCEPCQSQYEQTHVSRQGGSL